MWIQRDQDRRGSFEIIKGYVILTTKGSSGHLGKKISSAASNSTVPIGLLGSAVRGKAITGTAAAVCAPTQDFSEGGKARGQGRKHVPCWGG